MGRIFKFLVYLVFVLLILVITAIIVIPLVIDPNDFKGEIAAQVKQATGRDLQLRGDIGLSVFPWLGLELNGLELSNAPGFGDQPFAAIERAHVRAKLVPLLNQQLEVDKVQLQGLRLHLARAEDGRTNWEDLAGPDRAKVDEATRRARTPEPSSGEIPRTLAGLAVGGLDVKDARVVWEDRSAGQRYQVSDLSLDTGAITPGQPLDVEMGFVFDTAQPPIKARVQMSGRVQGDPALQSIRVSALELKASEVRAEGLDGEATLSGTLDADLPAQRYVADGLRLGIRLTGGGLPEAGAAAGLAAHVTADLRKQTLEVTNLRLDSGRLQLTGELHGTAIRTAPRFVGDLTLLPFSPRQLLKDLGLTAPRTADPSVFERVSAVFHVQSTADAVDLDNLALVLDDTKLDGKVRLLNPTRPAVRFELQVDRIDLDRYLPPEAGQPDAPPAQPPATAAAAQGEPRSPAPLFPVDTLRDLDLQGVFRVGHLVIQKLQAREIELIVNTKQGRMQINDRVKQFYDGSLNGSVKLDVSGTSPRLSIDQQMAGLQAGPLLRDLTGEDRLTGTGQFNVNLSAAGDNVEAIKRSLGGRLDFRLENGAFKGFNLAKTIREAKARLAGRPLAPSDEPEQTDFSELSGSALVTKGVLDNQDLLAKSPYLRVTGKGQANLVRENLDYLLTAVVVSTEKGQGGEGLEELEGIPVPVHFTGPFAKPDYRIDLKTVLAEAQKGKLQEKVDKELDRALGDKVDAGVKDQVKGLLKGFLR